MEMGSPYFAKYHREYHESQPSQGGQIETAQLDHLDREALPGIAPDWWERTMAPAAKEIVVLELFQHHIWCP